MPGLSGSRSLGQGNLNSSAQENTDGSPHLRGRFGCRRGAEYGSSSHRRCTATARAKSTQRGPCPWAVCRRLMLVRSHRAATSGRNQRDFCAKSVDDSGRERGGGAARFGPAGRSDGAGRAFLFRHDRHRSRRRSQSDCTRLRRGAGSRCRRGLYGTGEAISDAAGLRGHRLVRRLRAAQRGGFLRDFAGDLPAAQARVLYAVQAPFNRTLLAGETTHAAWRSSRAGTPCPPRIGRSIRIWNGSWRSGWAPPRSR